MELFFRTGSGKSSGSGHRFTWKAVGESAEMDGVVVVRHCRAGQIGQRQSAKTGRT